MLAFTTQPRTSLPAQGLVRKFPSCRQVILTHFNCLRKIARSLKKSGPSSAIISHNFRLKALYRSSSPEFHFTIFSLTSLDRFCLSVSLLSLSLKYRISSIFQQSRLFKSTSDSSKYSMSITTSNSLCRNRMQFCTRLRSS